MGSDPRHAITYTTAEVHEIVRAWVVDVENEDADNHTRHCEGCLKPAYRADSANVPLCIECFDALLEDSMPDDDGTAQVIPFPEAPDGQ